ncbi:MAG: biotin-dependent carboxyltransferase family protein, partial [Marinirhabdus sp.]
MINVAAPGLYSSIQDLGRFGYRALGVPVGGAMDAVSAKHANALLGNPPGCAVLECTALGPTLEFSRPALLAFSGAGFELKLNGRGLSTATPFMVESGTALKIGTAKQGMRGYLAVLGGFTSETALGSQSWYEGVTVKKMLQKNDRLFFGTPKEKPQGTTGLRRILKKIPPIKKTAVGYKKDTIEVYPGPEFYMLPEKSKAVLLGAAFTILPQSNRMGYYLETTTVVGA